MCPQIGRILGGGLCLTPGLRHARSGTSRYPAIGCGGVPEWPKGTGCKPVGSAFGGSNPPSPIQALQRVIRAVSGVAAARLSGVDTGSLSSPVPSEAGPHRRGFGDDPGEAAREHGDGGMAGTGRACRCRLLRRVYGNRGVHVRGIGGSVPAAEAACTETTGSWRRFWPGQPRGSAIRATRRRIPAGRRGRGQSCAAWLCRACRTLAMLCDTAATARAQAVRMSRLPSPG